MIERLRPLLPSGLSDPRVRETGAGLALALLVSGRIWGLPRLVDLSAALLFLAVAAPRILRPAATAWIAILRLSGAALSALLLCLLFFFVALPIGLVRRLAGSDELQSRRWGDGTPSVFTIRDRPFGAGDLDHPY